MSPAARYYKQRPRLSRACLVCGLTFTAKASAVYCGNACRQKAKRQRIKEALREEQRKRFQALSAWWHSQTDLLSNPDAKIEHPAYQTVINELGRSAVPFILEELRTHGGQWYQALSEITGVSPALPIEAPYSLRAEHQAWLDWGTAQGF